MVQYIPPPDPRSILPPLLACLPTAFASSRPPPALLPLLSPILRQRVQLLSASSSASESWLPLLCWDQQRGSRLAGIIERIEIEPHPTSGEVEVSDVDEIEYRRLDQETLHSRLKLEEFGLLPIYLWCMTDEAGGGEGWRLAELRGLEDGYDDSQWHKSITEANEKAQENYVRDAISAAEQGGAGNGDANAGDKDEDDDDAYWAAYDRTPNRTPAKNPSPAPRAGSSAQMPSTSELEYFARYMSEVQPAMDPHDPDEEGVGPGESTLDGNQFITAPRSHQTQPDTIAEENLASASSDAVPVPSALVDAASDAGYGQLPPPQEKEVESPRPRSPASSAGSIARLEQKAESQSLAEIGIKQHISTDIKSLFRLARAAGIERQEFERIVSTELQLLDMMDME